MLKDKIIAKLCSIVMVSSLPFIVAGMVGAGHGVLYVSAAIGIMGLLGMVLGLIYKERPFVSQHQTLLMSMLLDLSFPYAIALSAVILIAHGINAAGGLWFALLLALFMIGGSLASFADKKHK